MFGSGRKIGFKSSTGWEKSHFGGFRRIIEDYPYIKVSSDLEIEADESSTDLTWYKANKLMKMFLLCAKEHKGIKALFKGGDKQPWFKMKWVPGMGNMPVPATKITTNPATMTNALNIVLANEQELAPLFEEYRDFIIGSKFSMVFEDEPEKQEGEGEGGEGEGQPGGEGGEDMCSTGGSGSGEGEEGSDGESGNDAPPTLTKEEMQALKEGKGKPMTAAEFKELQHKIEERIENDTQKSEFGSPSGTAVRYGKSVAMAYTKKPKFMNVKAKMSPTIIQGYQKQQAELLLKMLDISWDSDKDIVKSLRMGKIDITKIAEVPAGNVAVYQREVEEMSTKPFSICILMDESGSMGHYWDNKTETESYVENYTHMYRLVKSLYHAFSQLVPEDKLYIYGHSGYESPEIYTYHDPFNPKFMYTVDDMKERRTMENYDGPVIQAIHKRVREFTDDRIIFLVLSDGAPAGQGYGGRRDYEDLKKIVEKARRDEFVTVGIGIQYAAVQDLYTYSTVVQNMDEMPKRVSHILNKVVKTEFQ